MTDRPKSSSGKPLRIHEFRHGGNTYEVRLEVVEGQPFALVYAPNGIRRPLLPFPDEIPSGMAPSAVRMGYIAVAEWLVKNDRWPDTETKTALLRARDLEQAA